MQSHLSDIAWQLSAIAYPWSIHSSSSPVRLITKPTRRAVALALLTRLDTCPAFSTMSKTGILTFRQPTASNQLNTSDLVAASVRNVMCLPLLLSVIVSLFQEGVAVLFSGGGAAAFSSGM